MGVEYRDFIRKIGKKNALIEYNKDNFVFSDNLNEEIIEIFFKDSCHLLTSKNILNASTCSNPIGKEFTITRPFELGVDYYLRRLNYNLIQNITQTFASTGIYS